GVEVAEIDVIDLARADSGDGPRHLAGDEGLAPARRLVVEQDPVGGVQAVGLAIVDGDPVGEDLRDRVWASWPERRRLGLRRLRDPAEHLARAGLVEADRPIGGPDRLEDPEGAHAGRLGRELGHLEADLDVALRPEVVDLFRLDPVEVADQRRRIGQVGVVEEEARPGFMRISVEMVDPPPVEGAGAAHEAVDLVALVEEQFGEVGAVLPGDPGDQRTLHVWAMVGAAEGVRDPAGSRRARARASRQSGIAATSRAKPWNQMIGRLRVAATGTVQRRSVRAPHQRITTETTSRIQRGIGIGEAWPGAST